MLNPDYKQTNKYTKELHVWETKDQQEAAPEGVKGSQKIRDGSYGAEEHINFAQNKMNDKGDKEGTTHGDYTLNQSPSAREVDLTKETQGEYLLRVPGKTVKVFYFLCFLLDPGPTIVYACQSLTH